MSGHSNKVFRANLFFGLAALVVFAYFFGRTTFTCDELDNSPGHPQFFVYTFYEPLDGREEDPGELALIELWRRSWERNGWTPIVLNRADAEAYERFEELDTKLAGLPSSNEEGYGGLFALDGRVGVEFTRAYHASASIP